MTLEQLTYIFEVYGSEPEKWPVDRVAEINDLLNNDKRAASLRSEFDEMGQALNQLYFPNFDDVEQQILDRQLPSRDFNPAARLLTWMCPKESSSLLSWRTILTASLPLFLGVLLSNYFSFGFNSELSDYEYWQEELAMLALLDDLEGEL